MLTSAKNETFKGLLKLKKKKYRDETGLYLVEGYHMVEEAINAGVVKMIVSSDESIHYDYDILYISDALNQKLSFTMTPQPVMAVCYKKENKQLLESGKRYLLLDNIQDPGNLGTIIRTSLALGIDQIILSDDTVDLFNDKVLRSTQGAIFKQNIISLPLEKAISLLKEQGVKTYATSLRNAKDIHQFKTEEKMAFVMGNEGNGVRDYILDLCDDCMYIPIESIESLNVAIATAIVLWQFNK